MIETTVRPDVGSVDLTDPKVMEAHFKAQRAPVSATPTPLPTWSLSCRDEGGGVGLPSGWHIALAGATGSGKSLMGLNVGARALMEGAAVGFCSFEMSRAQLATRLYAIATQTPVQTLEPGRKFSDQAAEAATERMATIGGMASFYTNDGPLGGIHEALELMKWWTEERYVRLHIVDYLQLARAWNAGSEYEAVSQVSSLVRSFAVEYGVTTIGLSQLNRSTTSNRAESPIVEGLKSTSSLEQDSDQVVLLDHSRYEREMGREKDLARSWILLAKNRHGPQVDIPVEWDYSTLRIREAKPDEEGKWPEHGRAG